MMATVIPDHGRVCKRRMEGPDADMLRQLQYPIPRPCQKQRLVVSVRSTNQLQFVLGAFALLAESTAFLWTMAGGNNNAIVEVGRNLIGCLYIVENHCQVPSKEEIVNQFVQSKLNAIGVEYRPSCEARSSRLVSRPTRIVCAECDRIFDSYCDSFRAIGLDKLCHVCLFPL